MIEFVLNLVTLGQHLFGSYVTLKEKIDIL